MSVIDTVKGALPDISLPELPHPELSLPEISLSDATKPIYALVGAGDLAVESAKEQVKELQDSLPKLQEQIPALPKTAQALPKTAQSKVTEYVSDVQGYVASLPAQLSTLRGQATPAGARAEYEKLSGKATALYGELAGRGEKVVEIVKGKIGVGGTTPTT